jgi:hypothetical protein
VREDLTKAGQLIGDTGAAQTTPELNVICSIIFDDIKRTNATTR